MAVTHTKVLTGPDGTNTNRAQPTDWNAAHTLDLSDYAGADLPGDAIPASHSGSTHAEAQAAAEATAAAANTADIATHAAIVAAHHAKYTDAEALAALVGETVVADALTINGEDLTPSRGTWTPTASLSTPGDLAVTYAKQEGRYIKHGKMVTVWGWVQAATWTHSTAAGAFRINGLPFTVVNTTSDIFHGSLWGSGWTKTTNTLVPTATNAATYLNINTSRSGVAPSWLAVADMPTGDLPLFGFTVTYEAA